MERKYYFKQALFSLLIVYPSACCIYIAMLERIQVYYQLSQLTYTKMIVPVFLFALMKFIFLCYGYNPVNKWCIKVTELIGMFEVFALITSTSLFWEFEFLHINAIRFVVVVPSFFVINIAGQSYFFYSTWNYIFCVMTEELQNTRGSAQGMFHCYHKIM